MRPFWHPISALFLPAIGTYATTNLIRMLLGTGQPVELVYGGDRMWPAVRHGQRLALSDPRGARPRRGDVVVAGLGSVADLFRVAAEGRDGSFLLHADSDPGPGERVGGEAILGPTGLPRRSAAAAGRWLRRISLDMREALRGIPHDDPAGSVREKYDLQAPYYAGTSGTVLEPAAVERIRAAVPAPGRILVVGSGTGSECFDLARSGFRVSGIDFSSAMVEQARGIARRQGVELPFVEGDIRSHAAEPASLDGVLFTFDVFSFVPREEERIELLRRMRGWLRPGGSVFLAVRRAEGLYVRAILSVQWRNSRRGGLGWGASHTRYLAPDGTLRRSFVHYFTPARLRREIGRAGFRMGDWSRGHVILSPSGGSAPRRRAEKPSA